MHYHILCNRIEQLVAAECFRTKNERGVKAAKGTAGLGNRMIPSGFFSAVAEQDQFDLEDCDEADEIDNEADAQSDGDKGEGGDDDLSMNEHNTNRKQLSKGKDVSKNSHGLDVGNSESSYEDGDDNNEVVDGEVSNFSEDGESDEEDGGRQAMDIMVKSILDSNVRKAVGMIGCMWGRFVAVGSYVQCVGYNIQLKCL